MPQSSTPTDPHGSTPPPASDSDQPGRFRQAPPLRPLAFLRWAWRQLTSMRTALLLLFALAVAAIPGSLVPQQAVNPVEVAAFAEDNPSLAEWYDRLGLFDVYSTPWFAAIYLALMVSLVGCFIPRTVQHIRAMRARPPRAPRNLDRLSAHRSWVSDEDPDELLARARRVLRRRRYRVVTDTDTNTNNGAVAAERGYLREVGNLVFHVAVTIVLIGMAFGGLFGFQGTALIVVGHGFANTVTQYDGYEAGRFFDSSQLPPFVINVDDFTVEFATQGEERGSPRSFEADLTYTSEPGAEPRDYQLEVNHPLEIAGAQVHLLNHGYAPSFTVRDGNGKVAASGPTPFLPQDSNFSSTGVIKAPDAEPDQLAFQGFFLPTATLDEEQGPQSIFPGPANPTVFLTAFHGDIGLDDGTPESIYELDTENLEQFQQDGDEPFRTALTPGESVELPNGAGSITFDGYEEWVNLQFSRNPGELVALTGAVLALVGVLGSLFIPRRRAWVRVTRDEGRTVIEVAGLDRAEARGAAARGVASSSNSGSGTASESGTVTGEIDDIAARLGASAEGQHDHQDRDDEQPGHEDPATEEGR